MTKKEKQDKVWGTEDMCGKEETHKIIDALSELTGGVVGADGARQAKVRQLQVTRRVEEQIAGLRREQGEVPQRGIEWDGTRGCWSANKRKRTGFLRKWFKKQSS